MLYLFIFIYIFLLFHTTKILNRTYKYNQNYYFYYNICYSNEEYKYFDLFKRFYRNYIFHILYYRIFFKKKYDSFNHYKIILGITYYTITEIIIFLIKLYKFLINYNTKTSFYEFLYLNYYSVEDLRKISFFNNTWNLNPHKLLNLMLKELYIKYPTLEETNFQNSIYKVYNAFHSDYIPNNISFYKINHIREIESGVKKWSHYTSDELTVDTKNYYPIVTDYNKACKNFYYDFKDIYIHKMMLNKPSIVFPCQDKMIKFSSNESIRLIKIPEINICKNIIEFEQFNSVLQQKNPADFLYSNNVNINNYNLLTEKLKPSIIEKKIKMETSFKEIHNILASHNVSESDIHSIFSQIFIDL